MIPPGESPPSAGGRPTGSPVRVETLRVHSDARGWVVEPLESTAFAGQRNAHLALSEPGVVRGNHWHRLATEVLTVVGPALVRTRCAGETTDTSIPAGEVVRFTIPPGVSHAVRNTGRAPSVLIAFSSHPHDSAAPDVVYDAILD